MKHQITAYCYNKRGHLVSIGHNSYTKSHPLQAYFAKKVGHPNKIYLHAEIAALIQSGICTENNVHEISIVRTNKKGEFRPSKPCPICIEALKAFNVQHVVYMNRVGITLSETVNELEES